MPSETLRFPDIRAADIRAVKRLAGQLIEVPDLGSLGREMIRGAGKILSADFMVWNLWTPAMDALLGFEANHDDYHDDLERLDAALTATIHHHPVIAAGQMEHCHLRPQRMSDYQSGRAFRSNPLFQEVYRHLDSHHQIVYTAAELCDSRIFLSWNLRSRDFTDREIQLMHLMGLQVGMLSRHVEERRHLRVAWESLAVNLGAVSGMTSSKADDVPTLGTNDGRIVSGLIRGVARAEIAASLKWRRDTLDRHLGGLRERLGFENSSQFLQALAALRPPPVRES